MKIMKYTLNGIPVEMGWSEANEDIVRQEADNGKYEIYDNGIVEHAIAAGNIIEGEYVTVDGVLYKAIMNIPSGEPIIAGQNAYETTVEEQLYELKGG